MIELETKVRKVFTITEKVPIRAKICLFFKIFASANVQFHIYLWWDNASLEKCLNRFLNVKKDLLCDCKNFATFVSSSKNSLI